MKTQWQKLSSASSIVTKHAIFIFIFILWFQVTLTAAFPFVDWNCYSDCAKSDPEVSGDTEKNFAELLTEELKLRENQAMENQQHADMALLEAKKFASQYQKEADKCNSGMETCEEAREKSELALVEQKKLTALWELRARQKGWKEGLAKSHARSQGKVQSS